MFLPLTGNMAETKKKAVAPRLLREITRPASLRLRLQAS